jgi:hypothetical protein
MVTEYEAWVVTKSWMNGCEPPHRSRWVAGPPLAIGLIVIGTLMLSAYERPHAIVSGPTAAFNLGLVLPPAISETTAPPL